MELRRPAPPAVGRESLDSAFLLRLVRVWESNFGSRLWEGFLARIEGLVGATHPYPGGSVLAVKERDVMDLAGRLGRDWLRPGLPSWCYVPPRFATSVPGRNPVASCNTPQGRAFSSALGCQPNVLSL